MLGPAHRGFQARFERLVDPDGVLDPVERALRADHAKRAHMLSLAAKSAAARMTKADRSHLAESTEQPGRKRRRP